MASPLTSAYAYLGGASAWFVHLCVVYAMGEGFCVLDALQERVWGLTMLAWLIGLVTALFLALTVGSLSASARAGGFDGRFGFYANGFFALAILLQGATALALQGQC